MAIVNQVTFAEVGNPKRVTQLTENTDAAGAYFLTEKVGESAAKKTSYATVESAVKSKVQSEYLQVLSATPASDKTMSEKLVVGELKKRDDKIVQLEQETSAIQTNVNNQLQAQDVDFQQKAAAEFEKNKAYVDGKSIEIAPASVTPETLSEATKQLINTAGGGSVTNLADDEDLVSTGNVLKFKDKAYQPSNFSGLGRKILRKNIDSVSGKNVLTQAMVNTPNTIYEIQYDYDLNGASITIPEGCVLNFTGGSFNNGGINGAIYIMSNNKCLKNIIINKTGDGFLKVDTLKLSWFCSENDTDSYITDSLENVLTTPCTTVLLDVKNIQLTRPVEFTREKNIYGYNIQNVYIYKNLYTTIQPSDTYKAITVNGETIDALFYCKSNFGGKISNIYFNGLFKTYNAVYMLSTASLCGEISLNKIYNFIGGGISFFGSEDCKIQNNYISYCNTSVSVNSALGNPINILDIKIKQDIVCNLVFIKNNYITYCNVGIVFYSGSDIYIENNCLSHNSMYALYGMSASGICNILYNYYESNGRSDFWIDSTGFVNTEGTMCLHLKNQHVGEFNKLRSSGWGLSSNNEGLLLRSDIAIYNTNNNGKYIIKGCRISGGRTGQHNRTKYTDKNDSVDNLALGVDAHVLFSNCGEVIIGDTYYNMAQNYPCNKYLGVVFNEFAISTNHKTTCIINNIPKKLIGTNFIKAATPNSSTCRFIMPCNPPIISTPKDIYDRFIYGGEKTNIHRIVSSMQNKNGILLYALSNYYRVTIKSQNEICDSSFGYIYCNFLNADVATIRIYKNDNQTYISSISVTQETDYISFFLDKDNIQSGDTIDVMITLNSGSYANCFLSIPYLYATSTNLGLYEHSEYYSYDGKNKVGRTNQRPVLYNSEFGFQYYDTSLKKYICWDGTAWTNLDGTALT